MMLNRNKNYRKARDVRLARKINKNGISYGEINKLLLQEYSIISIMNSAPSYEAWRSKRLRYHDSFKKSRIISDWINPYILPRKMYEFKYIFNY